MATAAGALAGLVIFVHFLGGTVMWLRFRKADLPADQAVALMTREQMLTVGLRLMVLPMIVSGLLAITLVWMGKRHRTPRRLAERRATERRAAVPAAGAPHSPERRVRDRRTRARRSGDERRSAERSSGTTLNRVLLGISAVVVVVLVLTLPGSWASLTWLALLLVIVYWWRGFGARQRRAGEEPSPWRLAAVAVVAAAIVSLGRQIDQPVQLLQTTAMVGSGAHAKRMTGVFITASDSAVYLGDTTTHRISAIPRDTVSLITLGPPLERAPNRSVLSKLLFRDRWSLTPLRWWCNGKDYALHDFDLLCKDQPKPAPDQRHQLDVRWIPVRIECPKTAKDDCEGYVRLRTRDTYSKALGRYALPRPVVFPNEHVDGVHFTLRRGRTGEVCVPTNGNEQKLLRAKSDVKRAKGRPVPLDIVVTSDPAGASQMSTAPMELDVGPADADPSMIVASDCGKPLRTALAKRPPRVTTVTAVRVPDAHQLVVDDHGTKKLVRLLGIESPSSLSWEPAACGEPQGTAALLRLVFTRARDTNGDGLVDTPGGRARTLRLEPDEHQLDRDPRRSYLLRYVRVAGEAHTLQEAALRSGWARLGRPHGEPVELLPALKRAARAGSRVTPNLRTKC
ncbi:hypothetical protein C8N24_2891 [Solirubrobacter pauli]|uniref:Uncharacterized protein n=1 Tax=Solirubrobacter pauli TaxID=166793 RepID=A0A660LDE4_9ACTN|nr:hypothetical protein [Solirubrobacter pauli]RKQ93032.1 hypothetical protein C8N24_2891 [Solirubrobacter pauli]